MSYLLKVLFLDENSNMTSIEEEVELPLTIAYLLSILRYNFEFVYTIDMLEDWDFPIYLAKRKVGYLKKEAFSTSITIEGNTWWDPESKSIKEEEFNV